MNLIIKKGTEMIKKINIILLVVLLLLSSACTEEFLDPANPVSAKVEESAEGLIGMAVGLQYRWSVGRQSPVYNIITGPGFITDELRLINPGNIDENQVDLGGTDLLNTNRIVSNLWEQALLTRQEAQIILDKVNSAVSNAGVKAGLIATANLYKALAFGTLIESFEKVPLTVAKNAGFSSRKEVLDEAIRALNEGKEAAASISNEFIAKTTGTIDIKNSINALLARYYLLAGKYTEAISAANSVDMSSKSTFAYDNVNPNPVAYISILTNNVFQPINLTLGLPEDLQPDSTDQRLSFYFENLNPDNEDFRAAAFFNQNEAGIPLYLPGEMTLIKAEAYARSNDLTNAIKELNKILTKKPDEDAFGIGAGFATGYSGAETQEAVLTEIYKQRCIELYMTGLRWGDSRRFNRPGPTDANPERNRNWYPYPDSERLNNSNTPSDPVN